MLIVVVSVCYILYFVWSQYRKFANSWKNAPSIVPLGKCIKILFKDVDLWSKALFLCKLVEDNGGVAVGYFYSRGFQRLYVVTDPEDAMTALKACGEKDYVYDFWVPWIGVTAFTGSVHVNKVHRKFFSKSFMPTKMEAFLKFFNTHSQRFVKKLSAHVDKGPYDVTRDLRMYNLALLCDTMLALEDTEVAKLDQYLDAVTDYVRIVAHRFEGVFLQHDFIFNWTALKQKQDAAIKNLHYTCDVVVDSRKEKLKYMKDNNIRPEGHQYWIDIMLEGVDKGVITELAMRSETNGTLFAGHDTSAYSMLYTLVLLGSYPEIQERAYEEIQNVMGGRTNVTKQDIASMVYLDAIIKESMRVYPYVIFLPRRLDEDLMLKNCTLSAGATVAVSSWSVHRNACWGPDAATFRPERWLEPDKLPKPTVLLGFSEGIRNCLGRRYAMMSMKVLLTQLISSFRFRADHTRMRFEYVGVLEPVAGHEIQIYKRETVVAEM